MDDLATTVKMVKNLEPIVKPPQLNRSCIRKL